MAKGDQSTSPDQDDKSSTPTASTFEFKGIGTYQDLQKEPTSVNQKSGNHGGGAGEPKA